MNRKRQLAIGGLALLAGAGISLWLTGTRPAIPEATDDRGPHGGRLLTDGSFAVEVTIYERGVPPEFRVYGYENGAPVDSAEIALTIDLLRFGARVQHIRFSPREGYLVGDRTVEEPHSFEVRVAADYDRTSHRWEYASWEGRTELSPEAIRAAGIVIETMGPASVTTRVRASGRVVPNENELTRVIPRYPGIVREVRKRLGDPVARDEALAVVESNDSLRRYEVRSAIAGTILEKDATPGAFAGEGQSIYTVADLSTVWVDLDVYPQDFSRLRVGQPVGIEAGRGIARGEGRISYLSPIGAQHTQTLLARIELPNPDGRWRPGLFASGEILVEETTVPLAVRPSALQTFRDWDVVFLNEGTVFQAMPLELGRRDEKWVEVLKGVDAGRRYVTEGSFIIKADIGKSGAVHEH
jgi:cobalt-zinc-cadmium efflux system membrane fusion protein